MYLRQSVFAASFAGFASVAFAQAPAVTIPAALSKPGDQIVAVIKGDGVLTYECYRDKGESYWMLLGPRMVMRQDGAVVGRIQRGPIWQHNDGSSVTGKSIASIPGKTEKDVAQERFETETKGTGLLAGVTAVVQMDTSDGTITSGGCKEHGWLVGPPFTATFVFLKSAQ